MVIKRSVLTLLAAAGLLLSGASMAGGDYLLAKPQAQAQPQPSASWAPVVYVQADAGYSHVAWNDFNFGGSYGSASNAGDGGFAYGLAAGLGLIQHVAVEGGWIHLPSTNYALGSRAYNVSSYLLYVAGKLSVPFGPFSSVYAKLGFAYRNLSNNAPFGGGSDTDLLYGLGVSYPLFSSLQVGGEYLHQSGTYTGASGSRMPNANLFLLTASYSFSI